MTVFEYTPVAGDQSDALEEWLNDPDHDGTLDARNTLLMPIYGLLPCERQITVTDRKAQNILWRGAQLVDTSPGGLRGDRHTSWYECEELTLRSGSVTGTAPPALGYDRTLEAQHAWEFLGSRDIQLINMGADAVWGDKIYLGPSRNGTWCESILIDRFRGGISHRHNIAVTAARYIVITDTCNFGEAKRTCYDFEANSPAGGCVQFMAEGARNGKHRLNWIACASGYGGRYENITFMNCIDYGSNIASTIEKRNAAGIYRDWTIMGCKGAQDPGGSGAVFDFAGVNGVTLCDNENPFTQSRMKFGAFTNCTDVDYHGNQPVDTLP